MRKIRNEKAQHLCCSLNFFLTVIGGVYLYRHYLPQVAEETLVVNVPTLDYTPSKAIELACGKTFYYDDIEEIGDGQYSAAETERKYITLSGVKVYVELEAGKSFVIHNNAEKFLSPEIAAMYFAEALEEPYDLVHAEVSTDTSPDLTKLTNPATVVCTTWTNSNFSVGTLLFLVLVALVMLVVISTVLSASNPKK